MLYGSSLSDGNQHNFSPLPIVLAGGASGRLKGGRHLQFPKDTHMSNLLLAMLDKLGARLDNFGDSTGMLTISGSQGRVQPRCLAADADTTASGVFVSAYGSAKP